MSHVHAPVGTVERHLSAKLGKCDCEIDLMELSEKIQNDLMAYFDGMSEELIDEVCLIVAKNCVRYEGEK